MSDKSPAGAILDPAAVKKKQYLILGVIGIGLLAATAIGVLFTTPQEAPVVQKPVEKSIVTPGAQLDPKDAWLGTTGAQINKIETEKKQLEERIKKLEQAVEDNKKLPPPQSRALPPDGTLPSPNVKQPVTPLKSAAGPAPAQTSPAPSAVLSPPPFQQNIGQGPQGLNQMPVSPRSVIATVELTPGKNNDGRALSSGGAAGAAKDMPTVKNYIPSGSFVRAVFLGGFDAPTGGAAAANPQPILLRLLDYAILPNKYRGKIKDCFIVGAGYGDLSSERAFIRTETLSCIGSNGNVIDVGLKGWAIGEDGKAGVRGRLISKQGQVLANALLAGIASGIGKAYQQSATTTSTTALGTLSTIDNDKALQSGIGSGVGSALDRLAQYYISLADKMFPIIEIDSARVVEIALSKGVSIEGLLEEPAVDAGGSGAFPSIAARNRGFQRGSGND